jgi:ATP-dependent RNA helicase DDX51/DBP6
VIRVVQAAILPKLLAPPLIPTRFDPIPDHLISAPTGSGKTLSYAIPLLQILSTRAVTRLRALIVLPTRDLVVQVRETLEALAKGTSLKVRFIPMNCPCLADQFTDRERYWTT